MVERLNFINDIFSSKSVSGEIRNIMILAQNFFVCALMGVNLVEKSADFTDNIDECLVGLLITLYLLLKWRNSGKSRGTWPTKTQASETQTHDQTRC
ncbi:unnamed protein product [Nesidiocoris tenuis]|uniref:Uncharacterized protein n=1 Tax=Nesidiocoris tenuis TaxID=355587 RepID=A0A6H5HS10_9HEMI|nr:unnamed protein product [Nesidiocoris tenuis]